MSELGPSSPPRRRHLLDPDNPRPPSSRGMSLDHVQKWVMSVLAVTTILHLAGGLSLAAALMDERHLDARIGLNVIAAAIGIVAVATGRLIHQKALLSPWLLLGLVPALVGTYFTFAR